MTSWEGQVGNGENVVAHASTRDQGRRAWDRAFKRTVRQLCKNETCTGWMKVSKKYRTVLNSKGPYGSCVKMKPVRAEWRFRRSTVRYAKLVKSPYGLWVDDWMIMLQTNAMYISKQLQSWENEGRRMNPPRWKKVRKRTKLMSVPPIFIYLFCLFIYYFFRHTDQTKKIQCFF